MKRFIPATIFSIAFGFLEAIVVVYLRKIYYPQGFKFPLTVLEPELLQVEVVREICTIIMLASIGWILGRTLGEKFSFFIFSFAIWDIFYYVALKVFLNWPSTILEWDVLFLIPITWIGPVLAPVICSFGMIVISIVYIYLSERNYSIKFYFGHIILILMGVLVIIYTFIYDYFNLMTINNFWQELPNILENPRFWDVIQSYIPTKFNWILFSVGCFLTAIGYFDTFRRAISKKL